MVKSIRLSKPKPHLYREVIPGNRDNFTERLYDKKKLVLLTESKLTLLHYSKFYFDIRDLSTRLCCFDHCSLCLFKLYFFHVQYVELVVFKPKTRRYRRRGTQKVVLCKRVKVFI